MKTIIATTALALTLVCSAASAREVTTHVTHFPKGTTFPLGTTLVLAPVTCNVLLVSEMEITTEKPLHLADAVTSNQNTPGCWYALNSDSFEVNLPGVTNGWQRMPRNEFTDQQMDFGG